MSGNKFWRKFHKGILGIFKLVNKRVPSFIKTKWFALAAVILIVGPLTIFNWATNQKNKYLISPAEKSIISKSSIDTKFIKESAKDFSYQRSDEAPKQSTLPQITTSSPENSTTKTQYSAKLSKNPKDGITFGDEKGERNFVIKSSSNLANAKQQDGSIIYPASAIEKHIYSFKKNGLKEDIVLSKASQSVLQFNWQITTGTALEARMLADGSVGMYSADPALFGDLTIADQKSQELVDKARKSGQKDYLIYIMPRPFIIDARGTKNYEDVSFKLNGNTLTLEAKNMLAKQYPLCIDPSIVVTTTTDFKQSAGDDANIDYTTTAQIGRGSIDSGATGTYSTVSSLVNSRSHHAVVAYNGYLYALGGFFSASSTYTATTEYVVINGDGTLGTWAATTSMPLGWGGLSGVAYNGFMYVLGGWDGTTYYSGVAYSAIASNGTLGTWNYTSSSNNDGGSFVGGFTTARYGHTSFAYNGYIYVIGGKSSSTSLSDVQYAQINANGTVGTWASTSSFSTGRYYHYSTIFNGFVYISGGWNGTTANSDIQYAAIGTSGTLGSWTTNATGMRGALFGHSMVAYGGYMYVSGGNTTAAATNESSYAKISPDGTVGPFTILDTMITRYGFGSVAYNNNLYHVGGRIFSGANVTSPNVYRATIGAGRAGSDSAFGNTSFTTSRRYHTSVAYNGFLYVIGGFTSSNVATVQYSAIADDGTNGSWTATTAFTTGRHSHTSVVHNGYLYVIGGCSSGTPPACTTYLSDVQYALIAADGSVGAWTSTTSFTTARKGHTSVVYNNYLYVIGGTTGTPQAGVQYAFICDGTATGGCTAGAANIGKVGTWAATTAFTTARYWHTSVVYNGYLYVIGGWDDTTYYNTVQYAKFSSTGTVGAWTATTAFSIGRHSHTSVVYNGYLYISVGIHAAADTNCLAASTVTCLDLQYSPIASDGSVGAWTVNQFTLSGRSGHTAVIYRGNLLLIGGANTVGTNLTSVNHLTIGPANTTSTWTATGSFTTARSGHSSVAYNGYVYVIGGNTGSATSNVQYGVLGSGGLTWSGNTSSLTTARYGHTSVVYNGYLYVIGGWNGTTYYNDIEYAAIASNGTLGAWSSAAASNFTTARYGHTSVVYNNYLFVIGGKSSSSALADVQYSYICDGTAAGGCTTGSANIGKLGTWASTTSFTSARYQHTSVVYNGYLYIIGGWDGSTYYGTTQFAAIASDGTIGAWNTTNSFFAGRYGHTSVVYNGYLYIIGGYHLASDTLCNAAASNYCTNIQVAQLFADGTIGSWDTSTTSSLASGRREHSSVVYNGYLYLMGGTTGANQSDTQSLTFYGPQQKAHYEHIFDTGSGNTPATLTINGASICGYDLEYKAGNATTGAYGSATKVPKSAPGKVITISEPGQRYLFLAITLDDTSCGGISTVTDITLVYKGPPNAPTLYQPANLETNTELLPEFRLGSTETFTDYLRYKIELCSTSNCSVIVRTIDQTSSQVGWQSQSQQSGTAYSGGPTQLQAAVHVYQPAALPGSTQYWWRAYAIAPGGSNGFSAASSISTFTTRPTPPVDLNFKGGVKIKGGTVLR